MGEEETRDDQWGNKVAKWTFILTVLSALGFVGSVFLFILKPGGGH